MCKRSILTIIAVAILALAIGPVQAATVTVPNGDFEEIYKPGSTTITADIGDGWTNGVGPDTPMESGQTAAYSDGTTGTVVDVPGWINTPGWPPSYAWPVGCGSIAGQNPTPDGVYYYTVNGGGWGNGQGGTIVSAESLGNVTGGVYTLSMIARGVDTPPATPVVLELLADGVALTPASSVDPVLSDEWQDFSRTYDAASLAGHIGESLTIQLGVGSDAIGAQSLFDLVTLDFESGDPTLPDVDAGVDMITWSGRAVQLDPNVVNNDVTPLTYLWSADPAAGVVFGPNAYIEAPTVTITKPALILTSISINNAGFEAPVLADGAATSTPPAWTNGYYDVTAPAVWVAGNSDAGGYNPSAAMGYGGIAPEGENVMYATSGVGFDRGMSQVLSAKLEANTQYILSVLVGNPFLFNGSTAAGNYRIELLAGGVLLKSDTGASPANDKTWKTASLTYDSGAGPVQLGQALAIRLVAVNFTNGKGVDFDSVRLTAEGPAPDPYVVKLTLAVNNAGKPAVTDTMKIDVYDDACEAARIGKGLGPDNPGDFDGDCITDGNDLAELVAKWLTGDALTVPIPKP